MWWLVFKSLWVSEWSLIVLQIQTMLLLVEIGFILGRGCCWKKALVLRRFVRRFTGFQKYNAQWVNGIVELAK